jgi:CheY-like chemotaxis protein
LSARFVLVVDDDPVVRELFSRAFRLIGAEVAEAGDGVAALRIVHHRVPDVVVTDVTMSRLDGIEFTRQLRRNPRTKDVPIVVVSGHASRGTIAEEAFQAGCDAVLSKPCTIATLMAVASESAERRKAGAGQTARNPTVGVSAA